MPGNAMRNSRMRSARIQKHKALIMGLTTLDESCWYAVSTRSRHEKAAAAMLKGFGIQHYLPLMKEVRRWSDRKHTVESPLFSGYLFVHISNSPESRLRVLKVPGIAGLVGNKNGPVPIPEREIENVRAVLSQGIEFFPYPYLTMGDRVRIVHGALAGVEGAFVRCGADAKLVISIEMIQRSVAITIDSCDVEAVCSRVMPNPLSLAPEAFMAHM